MKHKTKIANDYPFPFTLADEKSNRNVEIFFMKDAA